MMTQILAIFKDSYRLLKSGKLFWLSFAIITLFGLVFLSIGNDENGLTLCFNLIKLDIPMFAGEGMGFKMFYFWIFDSILVGFLLTWLVPMLGLVSTSTLFPGFMREGSIDIALSKPISRFGLFFLKYLGGLLFVLLQVSLFSLFLYLCLGIRLGEWTPKIFIIIPIVTLVFSYLYVVNVFWGVLTRTPIISLTLTLIFWLMVWGVQNAEELMCRLQIDFELRMEQAAKVSGHEEEKQVLARQFEQIKYWHSMVYYFHLAFPKIQETTNLVDRYVVPDSDEPIYKMKKDDQSRRAAFFKEQKEITDRLEAQLKKRSLWYVLGTSILFEAAVFALACWLFSRRDY